MKKTLMTMALAFVSLAGFNAAAQNADNASQNPRTCCQAQGQNCDSIECKKDIFASPVFQGITLTDAQKEQITALYAETGPKAQPRDGQKLEKKDKATDQDKQARKEGKRERKDMKLDLRKKRLEGMKQILSADQYVTYLENLVLNPGGGPQKAKMGKSGKGGKQGRDGRGGNPQRRQGDRRGQRPQPQQS